MPRGQTAHLKNDQYRVKGDRPLAKSPLSVRLPEDTDKLLRSMPDRSLWLQEVIDRAAKEYRRSLCGCKFTPVWNADCTLSEVCWSCKETKEPSTATLLEMKQGCIDTRKEYQDIADSAKAKARKKKFLQAVADKDRQIQWLDSELCDRAKEPTQKSA